MPRKNKRKFKDIYRPLNMKRLKKETRKDNILIRNPSRKEQKDDEGIGRLVMYAEVKVR